MDWPAPWGGVFAVVGVAAWVGGMARSRVSRVEAAHRIDQAMGLKDRVVSALEFSALPHPRAVHRLQVADTGEHLRDARADRIVPWRLKRDAVLLACALTLLIIGQVPRGPGEAQAVAWSPAPRAVSLESVELTKQLTSLAEDIDTQADEMLHRTIEEVKKMAESMSRPGSNLETAFDTLGMIRSRLQDALRELDPAANEAMMAAWAKALNEFPHTRLVGSPLSRRDFSQAGRNMQELAADASNPESGFVEQSEGLAGEMERLADQAKQAGLTELGGSMETLSRGVRGEDRVQCSSALQQQSRQIREQGVRQDLAKALQQQLRQLSESRQSLSSSYCPSCRSGGECENGSMPCRSDGLASGRGESSETATSPGVQAGTGDHAEPVGDPTQLDTFRSKESVTGLMNAGPSRITIEQGPAAEQYASTDYRNVYSRYRKMSDDVLQHEALPTGYHAVIRRYFESIRPIEDKQEAELGERPAAGERYD